MALSFDDRILGEKVDYYCSSSSEDESDLVIKKDGEGEVNPPSNYTNYSGLSGNTGPKGVIEDWRRFKQLEVEQRDEQAAEKLRLAQKLSLTCRTTKEDEEEREFNEMLEDSEDEFLRQYRIQRIKEMHQQIQSNVEYGKVYELTRMTFLEGIDNTPPNVIIIVHLYKQNVQACLSMTRCFLCLCKEYSHIKFCQLSVAEAPLSINFYLNALPSILIYKNKELVGNFLRISEELGDEFYATDVEGFLVEHGFLNDDSSYKKSIRCSTNQKPDIDSDFELDT